MTHMVALPAMASDFDGEPHPIDVGNVVVQTRSIPPHVDEGGLHLVDLFLQRTIPIGCDSGSGPLLRR